MYCIVAALFRHKLRLENNPDRFYDDMNSNQKMYMKRKMKDPRFYETVINEINEQGLLDFTNFTDVVDFNQVDAWELKNGVSVSFFHILNNEFVPLQQTRHNFARHVSLLYVERKDLTLTEQFNHYGTEGHFVLIQNESNFFCCNSSYKKAVCRFCGIIKGKKYIANHEDKCTLMNSLGIKFPIEQKANKIGWHRYVAAPYIAFAELLPLQSEDDSLKIAGYSFLILGPYRENLFHHTYIGEDAIDNFCKVVCEQASLYMKLIKEILPLAPSEIDFVNKKNSKFCLICNEGFTPENPACLDHDHHNKDMAIRSLCQNFNLNARPKDWLQIFMSHASDIFIQCLAPTLKNHTHSHVKFTPKRNSGFNE